MTITCNCGHEITDYCHYNKATEIGEYFYEVQADCEHCGAEYEFSEWGEVEEGEDITGLIQDHIKANQPRI